MITNAACPALLSWLLLSDLRQLSAAKWRRKSDALSRYVICMSDTAVFVIKA
jgi:hypothetical protein